MVAILVSKSLCVDNDYWEVGTYMCVCVCLNMSRCNSGLVSGRRIWWCRGVNDGQRRLISGRSQWLDDRRCAADTDATGM